jgi:signal peptidase I
MEPILKDRSEVLISSIPYIFSKPRPGDIIAFWNFNKVFIKRVKKEKQGNYLVEGDNVIDTLRIGWITKKDIIGKVIFKL